MLRNPIPKDQNTAPLHWVFEQISSILGPVLGRSQYLGDRILLKKLVSLYDPTTRVPVSPAMLPGSGIPGIRDLAAAIPILFQRAWILNRILGA